MSGTTSLLSPALKDSRKHNWRIYDSPPLPHFRHGPEERQDLSRARTRILVSEVLCGYCCHCKPESYGEGRGVRAHIPIWGRFLFLFLVQ